jgi:hemerythrin
MFEWTPKLALGYPLIDAQHQELFRRLNELLLLSLRGKGTNQINDTLNFLADYIVFHFAAEEAVMRSSGFPVELCSRHKRAHAQFIQTVSGLNAEWRQKGASSNLALQVQEQLCGWLTHHIQDMDQILGRHLNTSQPPETAA